MIAKPVLIAIGFVATALAIAGVILPGLPTTPFLLVALWAFARSSERLHGWLHRIPILKSALVEAHRFEQRRAVRLPVKVLALSCAWGSVAVTGALTRGERPILLIVVGLAALSATVFMLWVPTDRS